MKNLTVKELDPLQNLINENSLEKLEMFLINHNLNSSERNKLVSIMVEAILPIALNRTSKKNLDNLK